MCYDTIVLGVGGVGGAVLYHLARRGQRVLGIDRFSPPHNRGSSHGETRVIRTAYFEHPDYVPLATSSLKLWRELESQVGRTLVHPVGLLQVGPSKGEVIPGLRLAAGLHDLPLTDIPLSDFHRRYSPLQMQPNDEALLEPHAGYLLVEDCVQAHLDAATACGASTVTGERFLRWRVNSDQSEVIVQTDVGEYRAGKIIVSLGAGNRDALDLPKLELTVLKKHVYWFAFPQDYGDEMTRLPVYLFENDAGVFYGFPSLDGRTIKVARHSGGESISGDVFNVDRSLDAEDQQLVARFLSVHFPEVPLQLARHDTCLYTMTPDAHFRIGSHPQYDRVLVAAGLSGHGFKFTPVLGEALAELAIDGTTRHPIAFLSPSRES